MFSEMDAFLLLSAGSVIWLYAVPVVSKKTKAANSVIFMLLIG
jgi:hypothetical protein